jgi:hypothetical protein
MSVIHSFSSSIADGGDATLVRPSNWNAEHQFSGTDIVSGSIMYVSGNVLKATATFYYDEPRGGIESWVTGSYIGLSAVVSGVNNPPQENPLGQMFFVKKAGRTLMKYQGGVGAEHPVQDSLIQDRIYVANANTNAATFTVVGGVTPVLSGALAAVAPAVTNFSSSLRRVDLGSAATIGQGVGVRGQGPEFWRGNTVGVGGFYVTTRFIVAQTATFVTGRNTRLNFCLCTSTFLTGAVEPTGVVNSFGICVSAGSTAAANTNYTFYMQSGTAAGTLVDTKIPMLVSDVMDMRIYCPPSGNSVYMSCQKLNPSGTENMSEVEFSSTMPNFPANNVMYNWALHMGTATSASVRLGVITAYAETDY